MQGGVNGWLTADGLAELHRIHETLVAGAYRKPWLGGVEHVTRDLQGYVYCKGVQVDHCMLSMNAADIQQHATAIAQNGLHLEAIGVPVARSTCFCPWFAEMDAEFPEVFKRLLYHCSHFYAHPNGRIAILLPSLTNEDKWPIRARYVEVHGSEINVRELPIRPPQVEYHALTEAGYAHLELHHNLETVHAWLNQAGISPEIAQRILDALLQHEIQGSVTNNITPEPRRLDRTNPI